MYEAFSNAWKSIEERFHGELMRHGRIRMEFHYTMGLFKNDAENRMIISAIWYRRSGRMVPPVSRCRIFHSGDVVPHQISFFDILVHQRV